MEFYTKRAKNGRTSKWVKFTCPQCGKIADVSWRPERFNGLCPTCKGGRQPGYNADDFIARAEEIHKGKYTYDKVEYVNAHVKVIITCPHHGDFLQKPSNHLALANGCPACGNYTKRKHLKDVPHYVYHVKFIESGLFKVGVTNKPVRYRFSGEPAYEELWVIECAGAEQAYTLEDRLLRQYRSYKYDGDPILKSGGNTELITVQIPKPELHT